MSREIKFRAWDKTAKEFIEQKGDLGFMLSGEVVGWLANKGEYEITQFTGLKDKNGKEIWEADLVKNTNGDIAEVKFERGAFVADWGRAMLNKVLYFWADTTFAVEVVGNAFEDPELLA